MLTLIISCAPFLRYDVFKEIDNCVEESNKYHPNAYDLDIRSKICSRVTDRMCVINKYCKNDVATLLRTVKIRILTINNKNYVQSKTQ